MLLLLLLLLFFSRSTTENTATQQGGHSLGKEQEPGDIHPKAIMRMTSSSNHTKDSTEGFLLLFSSRSTTKTQQHNKVCTLSANLLHRRQTDAENDEEKSIVD